MEAAAIVTKSPQKEEIVHLCFSRAGQRGLPSKRKPLVWTPARMESKLLNSILRISSQGIY